MTNGFGAGGSGPGGFGPSDYDKAVRQYWNQWGEMMRQAAAAAPTAAGVTPGLGMPGMPGFDAAAPVPGWTEAMAWWSNLAKPAGAGGAPAAAVNDAVNQFNSQARSWFELMQQVAAQATPGAGPADVSQAWQRALGGLGDNPFADMFRTMRGPGQQGFDSWLEQAAPYLQGLGGWQGDGKSLLGQPTFGFTREHQQRWQQLMLANIDYQQHSQAYNALMGEAAQSAFKLFETKLAERTEPGRQLESARALFDLWIEAAEEAYAEIALSQRFRETYGAMVNSQMRLRGGLQREVEEVCDLFGMPTRTEVDSAHRKVVQVERELRRIRDALEALGGLDELAARASAADRPARAAPGKVKPAEPRATSRQAPVSSNSAASKKIATKTTATKKIAKKRIAAKKTSPKTPKARAETTRTSTTPTVRKPARKAAKKAAQQRVAKSPTRAAGKPAAPARKRRAAPGAKRTSR